MLNVYGHVIMLENFIEHDKSSHVRIHSFKITQFTIHKPISDWKVSKQTKGDMVYIDNESQRTVEYFIYIVYHQSPDRARCAMRCFSRIKAAGVERSGRRMRDWFIRTLPVYKVYRIYCVIIM